MDGERNKKENVMVGSTSRPHRSNRLHDAQKLTSLLSKQGLRHPPHLVVLDGKKKDNSQRMTIHAAQAPQRDGK
ncbi:hypothetical protein OsI_03418 [Oryza sativa Indica Group]|jgi:hypothetical protein|uniref:Uncharacterized protein n=1 Tax=Oryza sativa subsp. indica TaxID=39946 RepID=B8A8B1_ORYSI|nr:hypothetical protein OsI_03418 [Oryza sativa Indica Group]